MQEFHIPTDKQITISLSKKECFWLIFDEDGTVTDGDPSGIHLSPKFKSGPVKRGDRDKYCAKGTGSVTCKFTPGKKHDLDTMHTILVDN